MKLLSIILLLPFCVHLQAQSYTNENFKQLLSGGLYSSKPSLISWKSEREFTSVFNSKLSLITISGDTLKTVSIDSLSQKTGLELKRAFEISWIDENRLLLIADSSACWYGWEADSVYSRLKLPRLTDTVYPSDKAIAYTMNNGLYIAYADGRLDTVMLPENGAVAGTVPYRHEFGSEKGCLWSPSERYLLFYVVDNSAVDPYPLLDYMSIPAKVQWIRYPLAGKAMENSRLCIYDTETKQSRYLNTEGLQKAYFTNFSWSPDEQQLYSFAINRSQDTASLWVFDAESGHFIEELFEETSPKYVEPENPVYFVNDADFVFLSERSGYNHLYFYSSANKSIRQLSRGKWEIVEFLQLSADKKHCFFVGTDEKKHIEQYVYRLNIETGKLDKLSDKKGEHYSYLNKAGTAWVDYFGSLDMYAQVSVGTAGSKKSVMLYEKQKPKETCKYPEVELFQLPTADNSSEMFCRLLKPIGFEKNKTYPLIIYVYNGPHLQLIQNRWMGGAGSTEQLLAACGYLVLAVDGRGSYGRGLEFENCIHRQNGIPQLADQLSALHFIKQKPFVDTSRIGVHGWSFGGYMTVNMMLNASGAIKAGVAGAPVMNWELYEVMYGERYMDTPAENPDGYEKTNLLLQAGKLNGGLLIINGGMDDVVIPQNSMLFLQNCVSKNIPVDYFYYPPHDHHVRGRDRLHLIYKIISYFDASLGGQE